MITLQDMFVESGGRPINIDGCQIVQMDQVPIPKLALVQIRFIGRKLFEGNAAVIAVRKPGKILLSDGSNAEAVETWDAVGLPRVVLHRVQSGGHTLDVYNKYYVTHNDGHVSKDSFTGNAGMHVTIVSENMRRYECSNGLGPLCLKDLVFELHWEAHSEAI